MRDPVDEENQAHIRGKKEKQTRKNKTYVQSNYLHLHSRHLNHMNTIVSIQPKNSDQSHKNLLVQKKEVTDLQKEKHCMLTYAQTVGTTINHMQWMNNVSDTKYVQKDPQHRRYEL